jgi:hypothetical protein
VRNRPRILYASHFEARGVELFRLVCEQDLEGIVCKHRSAPYGSESVPWVESAQSGVLAARWLARAFRQTAGRDGALGCAAVLQGFDIDTSPALIADVRGAV